MNDEYERGFIFGDEQKNGLGTVTIHYGLKTLEDRIADLVDREGWNGYLFPPSAADVGYDTPNTITARFRRLAERTDVRVRGETPTPQSVIGSDFGRFSRPAAVGRR